MELFTAISVWFKGLFDSLGLTGGQALVVVAFGWYLMDMNAKIDALGRSIVQQGHRLDVAVLKIDGRFTEVKRDLDERITEVKNSLEGKITEVKNSLEGKITEVNNSLEGKITGVNNSLEGKITDVKNSLETQITEVKTQIRELKTNDIAHVADGVSEIAFLLKEHRVFSEDEAERVKDMLQLQRGQGEHS